MHSCGNDFVILPSFTAPLLDLTAEQCQNIAHRHYGLGCDQILCVDPDIESRQATVKIYNQDGSVAKACGNGSRCVVAWLDSLSPSPTTWTLRVGTDSIKGHIHSDTFVTIMQGKAQPIVQKSFAMDIVGVSVDIGNRHFIVSVHDVDPRYEKTSPIMNKAQELSQHYDANISFVQHLDDHKILARTWERGVGWTLSCGSAACAIACALDMSSCSILTKGGALEVYQSQDNWCHKGQAVWVAKGNLYDH